MRFVLLISGLLLLTACQPLHVVSKSNRGYSPQARTFLKDGDIWIEMKFFEPEGGKVWSTRLEGGSPVGLENYVEDPYQFMKWKVKTAGEKWERKEFVVFLTYGDLSREIQISLSSQGFNTAKEAAQLLLTVTSPLRVLTH